MKHLIDVGPRLAECNRCNAYVLAGMQSGCRFAVDPSPLNPATYRALTLVGAMTWKLKGQFFGDHGCGCSALDASAFEECEIPPLQAPVTQEEDVFGQQGLTCSVVQDVRPHRSDVVRCDECKEIILAHEARVMLEFPVWQEDNVIKVRGVPGRKGYTKVHPPGYGYTRWAIHQHGCRVPTPTRQT